MTSVPGRIRRGALDNGQNEVERAHYAFVLDLEKYLVIARQRESCPEGYGSRLVRAEAVRECRGQKPFECVRRVPRFGGVRVHVFERSVAQ